MLDIAAPPAPQLGWMIDLAGAIGGLAAGTSLILWGRTLQRPVILLGLAGLGALVAGTVGSWFSGADAVLVLIGAVFVLVVAGLFIARFAWAAVLAGLAGAVLAVVLAGSFQPSPPAPAARPENVSFPAWARAAGETLSHHTARSMWVDKAAYWTFRPMAEIQWTEAAWKVQLAVAVTTLVVLILACFAGPLPAFLMCSLLGGSCVLGGLAMLADWVWPAAWPAAWNHPLWVLAALAVLTAAGMALQCRAVVRDRRNKKVDEPATAG